ncbi:hypothetical protein J6T21_00145 [Candidatus Saccharibacteria bacterium]|nr:hypothetical protein [Candidatus Saccharibacteria bacterium]
MLDEKKLKDLILLVDSSKIEEALGKICEMDKLGQREAFDKILTECYDGILLIELAIEKKMLNPSMAQRAEIKNLSESTKARIKNAQELGLIEEDAKAVSNKHQAKIIKIA